VDNNVDKWDNFIHNKPLKYAFGSRFWRLRQHRRRSRANTYTDKNNKDASKQAGRYGIDICFLGKIINEKILGG